MTRETEKAKFHRVAVERLEIDLDRCNNTYGIAPCTAAGAVGSECYNTFASCQDRPNYARGTQTIKFCHRGGIFSPGEEVRPYITKIDSAPTEIARDKGIAIRGSASVALVDEPAIETLDPYRSTRSREAGGTFFGRLMARNTNYVGRTARLRRGFATEPFSLDAVRDEEYIIDNIQGPDDAGRVTIKLADRIKLTDRVKLPAPTNGKLLADLPSYSLVTYCRGGSSVTVQFSADAQPIDGYYVGQEVKIISGNGTGQSRFIGSYVGETRLATVSVAWEENPSTNSVVEVSPLSVEVSNISQYAADGYVRMGDEIIRYSAIDGDKLTWPSSEYRAQFGSERLDHSADDNVQQCLVYIDESAFAVVRSLLVAAGIDPANIDQTGISAELDDWAPKAVATTTACIAQPETVSSLLAEVCRDYNLLLWWDPVAAKVKGICDTPEQTANLTRITDDELTWRTVKTTRRDADRITEAGAYIGIRSPVANKGEPNSYLAGELVIDADAESANEYNDVRQDIIYSRWMTQANQVLVKANTGRKLRRRRDVPVRFSFRLDYKDELSLGQLIEVETRMLVGFDGYPKVTRARVIKIDDTGTGQQVEALSVGLTRRYAFVAPAGQANYLSATDDQRAKYGFISDNADQLMSNDDEGYYAP